MSVLGILFGGVLSIVLWYEVASEFSGAETLSSGHLIISGRHPGHDYWGPGWVCDCRTGGNIFTRGVHTGVGIVTARKYFRN